jgi:cell division protein FtsL
VAELEQEFRAGQKDLAELVSEAKSRERVARRRALLYTFLPIIIGAIFLTVSLVKVSRLEKTATDLNNQIASKKTELEALEGEKKEVEADRIAFRTTLEDIKIDPSNAQEKAREALKIVSDKVPTATPLVRQPTIAPGFVTNYHFKGPAQTSITIEVIPDRNLLSNPTRTNTLFTYQITGAPTREATGATSFRVTLDRSKTVALTFDFPREGAGGYTVRQTASAGKRPKSTFPVNPNVKRPGYPVTLYFSVE